MLIVRRFLVLCTAMSVHSGLLAERIETPAALREDVEFWEQIFGVYKSNECVLHDPDHVSVIYAIKKLKHCGGRHRDREINMARKQIADSLNRLARDPSSDVKVDTMIWARLPEKFRNSHYLREAKFRVRCQLGVADGFEKSLARSQKFLPEIKALARKKGLPEDVAYLPHLESGFNPRAHSKVGARGLWQLMPSLAREHGLKVNRSRDDRLHVDHSTRIALRQLTHNYRKVESWPLALTGYNYGINGIARGMKRLGTNDYMVIRKKHSSPSFGFAAKHFFPSFLAARNLAVRYEDRRRS